VNYTWSVRLGILAIGFVCFGSSRAEAISYGGAGTGAKVTVPATGTVIRAASGSVPISGGGTEAALLVGDIPGSATGGVVSLAAGVMRSAIVGLDATRGEASMADIALTVSGNQITSDFLLARGTASCGPAATGNSQVVNLVINGQPITVTGNPNQTVTLSNGTVIINEQSSSVGGTTAAMSVSGLHVTTTDPVTHAQLADVVLADVDAQIDCSGGPPPSGDFGTGGGWVIGNLGDKANFGVVGGTQPNGAFRGHLVFKDRSTGFSLQSTSITFVDHIGCTTKIDGIANTTSGNNVPFHVEITDAAEPGVPLDEITLSGPYANDHINLSGGNIQDHSAACP
jgi:hypothetical protein